METRKFAIEQAIKLISSTTIENKTRAAFDFADQIIQWIGDAPTCEASPFVPFTPIMPIYTTPPSCTPTPQVYQPWEITCGSGTVDVIK